MLLRDYFNSLNFYKNGELSRNQIGRSGVQVKKENEKFTVVRSRSPQNLKCGHFTLLFCRRRQRNVPKCKTHVQSNFFWLICFAALSFPSPSSLLKLPNNITETSCMMSSHYRYRARKFFRAILPLSERLNFLIFREPVTCKLFFCVRFH